MDNANKESIAIYKNRGFRLVEAQGHRILICKAKNDREQFMRPTYSIWASALSGSVTPSRSANGLIRSSAWNWPARQSEPSMWTQGHDSVREREDLPANPVL